ncbi:restriction endonuclease [Rhizobium sp.]|jgi:hypothetical protein|uniref:restriction endonuclease n=1 Tax=Rhizobium sp. TaxID=391 RepID=UPI000E833286|nr:hypothetical protein [Rhizobium sp.]
MSNFFDTKSDPEAFLFVWRGSRDVSEILNPWSGWNWRCPFCSVKLLKYASVATDYGSVAAGSSHETYMRCPICGWIHVHYNFDEPGSMSHGDRYYANTLFKTSVNDPLLTLDELGSHLKKRLSDIYSLSWQRFEDLTADLFRRAFNCEVVQTARSKDGGADLLLLARKGGEIEAIVECKKYAEDKKIGIRLVRELAGVCVDLDVKRATLLTTASFTSGARAGSERYRSRGFEINLADATQILAWLQCYNTALPPLEKIGTDVVRQLAAANASAIENALRLPVMSGVLAMAGGGKRDDQIEDDWLSS